MIETCRKLGINPADYLRDLLEALPGMEQKEAVNWTPAKWLTKKKPPTLSSETLPTHCEVV
ncbi:MAG: transposase domain-containing protein [Pontiellaceae bacterium]|nr:transposase domain-containing protein [Pontiellaceae bacterium]